MQNFFLQFQLPSKHFDDVDAVLVVAADAVVDVDVLSALCTSCQAVDHILRSRGDLGEKKSTDRN